MTSRCSCGVTFIEESCQGMRKPQNCKAAGDNRVVELWWRVIDRLFDGAHTSCVVVCSNLIRIKPPLKLHACMHVGCAVCGQSAHVVMTQREVQPVFDTMAECALSVAYSYSTYTNGARTNILYILESRKEGSTTNHTERPCTVKWDKADRQCTEGSATWHPIGLPWDCGSVSFVHSIDFFTDLKTLKGREKIPVIRCTCKE